MAYKNYSVVYEISPVSIAIFWMVLAALLLIFMLVFFDFFTRYPVSIVVWDLLYIALQYLRPCNGPYRPKDITKICYIQCISNCLRKIKVGIIFLPFWKCPDASDVFISVMARYHKNLQSCQKLVSHIFSRYIGEWHLFLWFYIWWR